MLSSKEVLQGEFTSTRRYGTQSNGFFHNGVDWAAPTGTPVLARHSGVIKTLGTNPPGQDFGNYIRMIYDNSNLDGWYAHLLDWTVSAGQHVVAGQIIAHSDNTGNSTGPHLHYSESETNTLHWIDPDTTQEGGVEMIDPKYYANGELFKYSDDPTVYLKFSTQEAYNAEIGDQSKLKDIGPNPVPVLTKERDNLQGEFNQAQNTITELNAQITDLKKQLGTMPAPNPTTPPSPPTAPHKTFWDWLKELLNKKVV